MENELIKILYIDDEKAALFNFAQLFNDDFEIYTANSAESGMEVLVNTDIQIIVSDQRMPHKTGVEFFLEVAQQYPNTIRILLTAYSEAADIIAAINQGQVYQYITKPFETRNVKNILDKAAQNWRLKKENEALVERLSLSQEVSSAGTWDWDIQNNTFYWSEEFLSLFGMESDTIPGFESWTKSLHPDDIALASKRIQDAIGEKTDLLQHYRIVLPDGTLRWIMSTGKVTYQNDVPIRMIGLCMDVTRQKLAEQKAMESQAELSKALEFANQSRHTLLSVIEDQQISEKEIKTLNKRLNLLIQAIQELSIAPNLESIMKNVRISARNLVNADGTTFVLREGELCFYADEDTITPLWKGQRFPLNTCISGWVMENKQSVTIKDIYNDSRIPIEAYKKTFVKSLAMVPIRTNNPLGAIGAYWQDNKTPSPTEVQLLQTLADATARAVENIRLVEDLEQRVKTRTAQLEALNKELETFTYSVSHDLKAPLRGIDGYSKLLSDLYATDLNDEAKHFISTIRSSTRLMSQLIDDLLQYSRLERSQLRSEPVIIIPFINAILKINEDEIISHCFSVTTDIPDKSIIADSNGIQMALRNLIENAIKFSKTVPEPSIEIKQEEAENFWIISVKDNGIGFDMKYSQRIFEIFQRLHRVEDYPGTGIGLAMVSKAMQRMNGRAWAESTAGMGATFYLEIPKPI